MFFYKNNILIYYFSDKDVFIYILSHSCNKTYNAREKILQNIEKQILTLYLS